MIKLFIPVGVILFVLAGCTKIELEYDRMTGTTFPQTETVASETVNLGTIYLQGDLLLVVDEDDTGITPLTGPFDPSDPNQYDYITQAEIDTVEAANRGSNVAVDEWACTFLGMNFTCRQYNLYGVVLNHWREKDDGTRPQGTLGRMYDSSLRRGFVNYYKNSTNNSDNGKYLRSTAHEIGHAVNLSHCDGDGSTTIMNQTWAVGDSYVYEFSTESLEHLQDHDRSFVWPGIGPRHYSCPHVH